MTDIYTSSNLFRELILSGEDGEEIKKLFNAQWLDKSNMAPEYIKYFFDNMPYVIDKITTTDIHTYIYIISYYQYDMKDDFINYIANKILCFDDSITYLKIIKEIDANIHVDILEIIKDTIHKKFKNIIDIEDYKCAQNSKYMFTSIIDENCDIYYKNYAITLYETTHKYYINYINLCEYCGVVPEPITRANISNFFELSTRYDQILNNREQIENTRNTYWEKNKWCCFDPVNTIRSCYKYCG